MQHQTIKNTLKEQQLIHGRLFLALFFLLLLLIVIVARFYYLQVLEYETYNTHAESNRVHLQRIAPKRGLIYDADNRLLAENVPSYLLAIVRDRVDDVEQTLTALRQLGVIDDDDIERFEKRRNRYRPFEPQPVGFNLDDQAIAKVLARRVHFPGVEIKANLARFYPEGAMFSHALGYVGRINQRELAKLDADNYGATHYIGKLGVENTYESELHGTVGYEYVETNAQGKTQRVLERRAPVPGKNIQLHLDIDLQRAAKKALSGFRGAIVALNAKNGGVLVAASTPSFDPNLFVQGISYENYNSLRDDVDLPLFNRFLQAQYPPGSTTKPIVSLAGLEENVYTLHTTIEDPGWYQLPDTERLYRDWKRQGHGTVGFEMALKQSCDVYFYDLAYKLGVDRLHEYYDKFGLGKETGVDLPHERRGLNPSKAWKRADKRGAWFHGDTLNIGIGQGFLLATPMQLANMVNIIANKGRRFVPQVVSQIGGVPVPAKELPPLQFKQPDKHWGALFSAMEAVVHDVRGTAHRMSYGMSYKMAGKSGTAQVVSIPQGELYDAEALAERKRDHALFVAFAPVEAPEIAVAVVVENGEGGSTVAGPMAKAVIDVWMEKAAKRKALSRRNQTGASDGL